MSDPIDFTWRQTSGYSWVVLNPNGTLAWRVRSEGSYYSLDRYCNGVYKDRKGGFNSLLDAQAWAEKFGQNSVLRPEPVKKSVKNAWNLLTHLFEDED